MHRDENKLPENQKIQWHPGFYAAAELELRHNRKDLEFHREYNLSKKPLQIDLLIIEKLKDIQIQNEIGKIRNTCIPESAYRQIGESWFF